MKINLGDGDFSGTSSHMVLEIVVAVIVTIATVLACLFFVNLLQQEVDTIKAEVQDLESKINKDSSMRAKRKVYQEKKEDLKKKSDAIAILESKQIGPVFLFSELSDLVASRIYFTEVNFEGREVNIKGKSIDNLVLSDFLTRLEGSDYFASVILEETKHSVEKGIDLVEFSIFGKVRLPRYE